MNLPKMMAEFQQSFFIASRAENIKLKREFFPRILIDKVKNQIKAFFGFKSPEEEKSEFRMSIHQ
jgi:hypothetical protein